MFLHSRDVFIEDFDDHLATLEICLCNVWENKLISVADKGPRVFLPAGDEENEARVVRESDLGVSIDDRPAWITTQGSWASNRLPVSLRSLPVISLTTICITETANGEWTHTIYPTNIHTPTPTGEYEKLEMKPTSAREREPWLRISTLRIMLLVCIAIAGLTSGALSYYFIRNYQHQLYKQEFDDSALDSYESIKESLLVKLQLNTQVALGFELACPTRAQWPHCSVSAEEFVYRTSSLTEVTQNSQYALLPIIPSASRRDFEDFALDLYQSDPGYPPGSGAFGMYAFDPSFNPIPASNLTMVGRYDIFVPVLQLSNISMGAAGLMYDTHSDPVIGPMLEQVLDCVSANSQASLSSTLGRKQIQTRCSIVTDFIPMLNLRSSVIGTPIFAFNEPDAVVGFAGSMFSWESVLSVTSRFDSTFQCVIESSTSPIKLMYSVRNGMVKEITRLEHVETSDGYFDDLTRSFNLDLEGYCSSQSKYTITYYSSKQPPSMVVAIIACVSCVAVALLIAVIFEVFNYLSKREIREAKTLLDSKRIFVRFISHEIRTPLNTVILGFQLLQEHLNSLNINSKVSEKLIMECLELTDELSENAAVAVTTLNDLINYDKIETKTFTIEKKMVNICSVTEKTVGLLGPQAKEKAVSILFESEEPNNLRVFGDSVKLAQVIRNLTSNAIKFTPPHGKITVRGTIDLLPRLLTSPLSPRTLVGFLSQNIPQSSHRSVLFSNYQTAPIAPENYGSSPDGAGQVVITVTDTGPGLSHEEQQTLFREGVQFNPNELQGGQGSGLGLWISREIVSLHGGHITATSEGVGMGSTFEVRLPLRRTFNLDDLPSPSAVLRKLELSNFRSSLARDFDSLPSSSPSPPQPAASPNSCLQSKPFSPEERHVLVVDDAPSNRKLVSRLLRSRGFVCHEAENGLQCVEKIFAAVVPYEFIVMDYEMPVMDGPSATRQLRENHLAIPIIGVTGNVLPEDREFFLKQGANAVLPKPVNIDDLLNKVNSLRAERV